jgi:hypothetical protein
LPYHCGFPEIKIVCQQIRYSFALTETRSSILTTEDQYEDIRLLALSDDALIDTYHQAMEDLRAARAEGSDNLCNAHALALATEEAMRDRFPDYRTRYKMRYQ